MASPILIIGAGISGLALAQGLKKNGIPFKIFEKDAEFHSRSQGYRVRLSDEGIQALEAVLSPEHFDRLCQCCGQGIQTSNVPSAAFDATTPGAPGEPLFKPGQGWKGPPGAVQSKVLSADRSTVREVLRQEIENIQYGKDFERYEEHDDGVTVYFRDGTAAHGSSLVAADGAWSRVRKQLLPDFKLVDSEGRLVFGKTVLSDKFTSIFSSKALSGLILLRSPQQTCLMETMRFDASLPETPKDYIYWVLFTRKDQHVPDGELLYLGPSETIRLARRLTSDYDPSFGALFDPQYEVSGTVFRVVTCRPSGIPLSTNKASRVVLIGDCGHPMPPTAALGATVGLADAATVLRQLLRSEHASNPAAAFRAYEDEMKVYAAASLEKSLVGGRAVFGMRPFDELPDIEH